MTIRSWSVDPVWPQLLTLGNLSASFQRYRRPRGDLIDSVPASLGALPVARFDDDRFLLPLASDEAFWLSLSSAEGSYLVTIHLRSEGRLVDVTDPMIQIPPMAIVGGVPQPGNKRRAFTRSTAHTPTDVVLNARVTGRPTKGSVATIQLVDYEEFSVRTGAPPPPPLNEAHGYGGYRLP